MAGNFCKAETRLASLAQRRLFASNMQCLDLCFFWSTAKHFMCSDSWRKLQMCNASTRLCKDVAVLSEHLHAIRAGTISIGSPLPVLPPHWHACLWHNLRTALRTQGARGRALPIRWLCDWALQASRAQADLAIHVYSPIACEVLVNDPNDLFPEIHELPRTMLGAYIVSASCMALRP